MAEVDKRLLDSRSQAEIDENFKRILSLIDGLSEKPGEPGPQGDPGVGVKTITGSIDAALRDIRIGYPGMFLQVVGGYLFIRYIIRKN